MVIQNYKDIKSRAKKTLSYTPWDVKKLALVFALVSWCAVPLLSGVDALLLKVAESGQGLSGLGLNSMASTISTLINWAWVIFNMFWAPGILYCGLMLLREQDPWPKGLFRGFKKWGSFVKLTVLLFAFYFALIMVISPVVSIISLPFMGDYLDILAAMPETEADMIAYMETIPMDQLVKSMLPMLILTFIIMLAIMIPLSYRFRMVQLILLDEDHLGVREAIRFSFALTKGSCKQLFLMDLSFWWYYLLQFAVSMLPLAALLPIFNGWSEIAANLTCDAAAAIAGIGVYMLGLMKVTTANAVAYDHLRTIVQPDAPQLTEGASDGI